MYCVAGLGLFASIMFISAALAGHAALNFLACAICHGFKVRQRTAAVALIGAMIAAYGLVIVPAAKEHAKIQAALARYPIVSLKVRLAFEKRVMLPAVSTETRDRPRLSAVVLTNLTQFEEDQDNRFDRRVRSLERLHNRTYRQFAFAAGFGYSRMPRMHVDYVDLEPRQLPKLPLSVNRVSELPQVSELYTVHREANNDFLEPQRIGYVAGHAQAAGFESHAFSELHERWQEKKNQPSKWQVFRLELVGILRNEAPQVYVTSELPAMDQLADVPHRPLTDFEKHSLTRLETDEDLIINHEPQKIQMLGSVRAATQCLECHEGLRGKLLGAFSYELTPIKPPNPSRAKHEGILASNRFWKYGVEQAAEHED